MMYSLTNISADLENTKMQLLESERESKIKGPEAGLAYFFFHFNAESIEVVFQIKS